MVRISGGASWPSLISGFDMRRKIWSTLFPSSKNTFCRDLIMKLQICTLFSISQQECHARLLLLLWWDRSRRPRPRLLEVRPTWKDARRQRFAYGFSYIPLVAGGLGGCHLDLARATWLLYFQTNTRPSSVGQDLISVSLAPERGDGDKVSGWWLSWAITGVFFCSKATGDGRHVEKAKEVSTHCKSLLLIATGSSPTWHVELNLLTSILSHFSGA